MTIEERGYWLAGDLKRWDYDYFIAIQTGSSVIPSFTCTNMDLAYKILMEELNKEKEREQPIDRKEHIDRKEISEIEENLMT